MAIRSRPRAGDPQGPPPADLSGFPSFRLRGPRVRIHRASVGPWWFNSDLTQRFDLPAPAGTCYLADDPNGAFIEVFRGFAGGLIPEAEITARRIARVRPPRSIRLADLLNERAAMFGVTAELGSTSDYERSQAWAGAFARAGFEGIRYHLRHDPTSRLVGIAVFGEAGERDWPVLADDPVDDRTVREVARRFGIRVLPGP